MKFVCPVSDCIDMLPQASQLPNVSWREYQRRLATGEISKIAPPLHTR